MWETETTSIYSMSRANDVYSGLGNSKTAENLPTDISDEQQPLAKPEDNKAEKEKEAKEEEDNDGNVIVLDGEEQEAAKETNPVTSIPESDTQQKETVVARAFDTVEHILDHLDHIRIFPMTISTAPNGTAEKKPPANASTGSETAAGESTSTAEQENKSAIAQLLNRQKYRGLFHGVFISARYAQLMSYPVLSDILAPAASSGISPVVAVETAKFLVPLTTDVKREFSNKIDEFAEQRQRLEKVRPVFRRRRDENDADDDVLFFKPR